MLEKHGKLYIFIYLLKLFGDQTVKLFTGGWIAYFPHFLGTQCEILESDLHRCRVHTAASEVNESCGVNI